MTPTDKHSLRIFVVENNADTLKYFRMYLEDLGHTVCTAATVARAMIEIPEARCDVLISDVGLSDGTGWDLLRALRARQLPCPAYAIAMSGFGMNADRTRSAEAGFRHHLLKPFEPEALEQLLEEAARERLASAH